MRMRLPILPLTQDALAALTAAIEREMINAVDIREAAPHLLLRSRGGVVYRLTVDDDGNLAATKVQG